MQRKQFIIHDDRVHVKLNRRVQIGVAGERREDVDLLGGDIRSEVGLESGIDGRGAADHDVSLRVVLLGLDTCCQFTRTCADKLEFAVGVQLVPLFHFKILLVLTGCGVNNYATLWNIFLLRRGFFLLLFSLSRCFRFRLFLLLCCS